MASDNRNNQDKVKLREGEWNITISYFYIDRRKYPSLSGFCMTHRGIFALHRSVCRIWQSFLNFWKLGCFRFLFRVVTTRPCPLCLDRKHDSAVLTDRFFIGHEVQCLIGLGFLYCRAYSVGDQFVCLENTQTTWMASLNNLSIFIIGLCFELACFI